MARRKYSRKASIGGGKLMHGFIKPKGIIAGAIIGLGAALVANQLVGQKIPYQNELVGFAVGGAPGAVANLALKMLPSINLGGSSGSGFINT